jgi:excinuclease ABC subunit C
VLRPHTPERFLVEQLRDEAHRFAITAHRNRRKARTLRSVLEEIPGVGPARRKALLKTFGSTEGVADADVDAIAAVAGVGPALAARIKEALTGPAPMSGDGADEEPASDDDLADLDDAQGIDEDDDGSGGLTDR